MVQVTEIYEYGKGRYLIHYRVYSPCMCSHIKRTKVVYRDTKPTEDEAEKLIYET